MKLEKIGRFPEKVDFCEFVLAATQKHLWLVREGMFFKRNSGSYLFNIGEDSVGIYLNKKGINNFGVNIAHTCAKAYAESLISELRASEANDALDYTIYSYYAVPRTPKKSKLYGSDFFITFPAYSDVMKKKIYKAYKDDLYLLKFHAKLDYYTVRDAVGAGSADKMTKFNLVFDVTDITAQKLL